MNAFGLLSHAQPSLIDLFNPNNLPRGLLSYGAQAPSPVATPSPAPVADDSEEDTPAAQVPAAPVAGLLAQPANPPMPTPRPTEFGGTDPAISAQSTAAPSPSEQGGFSKFMSGIGNIYGNGGSGDALINLGLGMASDPTNWASGALKGLQTTNSQKFQQAQNQLAQARAQQAMGTMQGSASLIRRANPNLSNEEVMGLAGNQSAINDALLKINGPKVTQTVDGNGNEWSINKTTGDKSLILKASDNENWTPLVDPAKRAANGISPDDNTPYLVNEKNNIKPINSGGIKVYNGPQTDYNGSMGEALAAPHIALAKGVEGAQAQARDLNAMSGALAQIKANGGITGFGQDTVTKLKSALNSGASALGMEPIADISNQEVLDKFSKGLAGAAAKDIGGARTTNFDLGLMMKANPGLELSPNANERIIGIKQQLAQRNVEVGQSLRDATAQALQNKRQVNPAEMEALVKQYDESHHITDPLTGQDLSKTVTLADQRQQSQSPAQNAPADFSQGRTKSGINFSIGH